jgi:glycerol-3-phosphate dehydrogenase
VLRETNRLFPTVGLRERDIVHRWCGVRPRTAATGAKDIVKLLSLHELAAEGYPNAVALTGMPIMNHRYAGQQIAARVARTLRATLTPRTLSHAARPFPRPEVRQPLSPEYPEVDVSDLIHAARHEHAHELADLMFRRVGLGWKPSMGLEVAERVARAIAPAMGWSDAEVSAQVRAYEAHVQDHFGPIRA